MKRLFFFLGFLGYFEELMIHYPTDDNVSNENNNVRYIFFICVIFLKCSFKNDRNIYTYKFIHIIQVEYV
jgi:hypothetical protein